MNTKVIVKLQNGSKIKKKSSQDGVHKEVLQLLGVLKELENKSVAKKLNERKQKALLKSKKHKIKKQKWDM